MGKDQNPEEPLDSACELVNQQLRILIFFCLDNIKNNGNFEVRRQTHHESVYGLRGMRADESIALILLREIVPFRGGLMSVTFCSGRFTDLEALGT